jgi:hypothetical protein
MALLRYSYSWIGLPAVMNISLLDSTIHSRFSINTTIEVLMKALFLEKWNVSFSYEQYYNTCAPISCTYNIEQQFDLSLVVVTAVAVYGGLNKGLRILIPLLVSLILLLRRYLRARRSTAVQTCEPMQTHEHPGKNHELFSGATNCTGVLCLSFLRILFGTLEIFVVASHLKESVSNR